MFSPKTWGRHYWNIIHLTGFYIDSTYTNPNQAKATFNQFLKIIIKILPCKICSTHFKNYMEEHELPIFEKGQTNFLKWTVIAHNSVNERLNKYQPDPNKVIDAYKNGNFFNNANNISTTKESQEYNNKPFNWLVLYIMTTIILIVIIIILSVCVVRKKTLK